MAAVQLLHSEALCSVCLEYFNEPVSISCGHNFCRGCIEACWANAGANLSCPQCRETIGEGAFRPNRELGNMVDLVKRLKLEEAAAAAAAAAGDGSPPAKGVCARHQEPLKLFCEQDEMPICVICRESRDHKIHKVLPIEEAAQDYKEQIQSELQKLKREWNDSMLGEVFNQNTIKQHLEVIEVERDAVVKEFDELYQFEQEQKSLFLDQLKELQKEVDDEQTSKTKTEAHLKTLIEDMEKICQQSDSEFLQDIKNILSRSSDLQKPGSTSSLTEKLAAFSQKNAALKLTLKNFRETFPSQLKKYERQPAMYSSLRGFDRESLFLRMSRHVHHTGKQDSESRNRRISSWRRPPGPSSPNPCHTGTQSND